MVGMATNVCHLFTYFLMDTTVAMDLNGASDRTPVHQNVCVTVINEWVEIATVGEFWDFLSIYFSNHQFFVFSACLQNLCPLNF